MPLKCIIQSNLSWKDFVWKSEYEQWLGFLLYISTMHPSRYGKMGGAGN